MAWESQERRRFPRAVFCCKAAVFSSDRRLPSFIENISSGGVKVNLEEKLNALEPVDLELYFEKDSTAKCKGRIVWVKERPIDEQRQAISFDTGVEFTDIHDYDSGYIKRLVKLLTLLKKEKSPTNLS